MLHYCSGVGLPNLCQLSGCKPAGSTSWCWSDNQTKCLVVICGVKSLAVQVHNGSVEKQEPSCVRFRRPVKDFQGLCNEGRLVSALDALFRMDQQGTVPTVEMYRSLLKACSKRKALSEAKQVHAHLIRHGLEVTGSLGETLVKTLVRCGPSGFGDALQLFHRLPKRTVVSWTSVIAGYTVAGKNREALRMFQEMTEEGVQPDKYTFVSLLKACGNARDIEEGKRIHAEAVKHQCDSNLFVATSLVDMYAKCANIVNAQRLFDSLSQKDAVLWNTMLSAYAQQGQADKAMQLYEKMQEEGVCQDKWIFVSALQACGVLAEKEREDGRVTTVSALGKGKAIHADAQRRGCDSDVFVGNTLISMYGKCGSIVDAENVFDGLSQRDVVSWNAMLAAYSQQGQAEEILMLYEEMQHERVSSDYRTFVGALQACAMLAEKEEDGMVDGRLIKVKSLEKGKKIHADAWRSSCDTDVFVGSILVTMYGKCKSAVDAQNVFERLAHHDVVSYTAMLAAYAQQGQAEKALQLYEQMREEGISENDRTFVSVLQACGILGEMEGGVLLDAQLIKVTSLEKGKNMHAAASVKNWYLDVFVGNTLISIYGKCGSILDAKRVFDGLTSLNVVSWNAMLVAYLEQGQADKSLQLYEEMREDGVTPNDRTFVTALQACGMVAEMDEEVSMTGQCTKVKSLEKGKSIHAEAQLKGYSSDIFLRNTLISMYGKCGGIEDAQTMFDALEHRDVVLWNTMLAAYAQQGQAENALQLYEQMTKEGVGANDRTFVSSLQACSMIADKEDDVVVDGQPIKAKALEQGKVLHADACRKGYESDVFVGSSLITMYGKCGKIVEAQKVFDALHERDVVAWTAMLTAYIEHGQGEKALQLHKQMQSDCMTPNEITTVCILQACSNTGNLKACRQIHHTLVSARNQPTLLLANTLINAYGRCASMGEARSVFDDILQPNTVSWTALIAGYAREGNCTESLRCYEEMQLVGTKPDRVTFLSLLSACSHAGLVDKGVEHFESMSKEHGITPEVEHYATMVDLLARAGYFRRAEHLLSTMPTQPDLPIWLCMLAACQKHGEVVLGEQAFRSAVSLQPRHSSAYVLMANIYADAGLWNHVKEVNQLREQAGAWKKPAHSWLEHEGQVHSFSAGDRGQPQDEHLYKFVTSIIS